jgi:hypothetical protein
MPEAFQAIPGVPPRSRAHDSANRAVSRLVYDPSSCCPSRFQPIIDAELIETRPTIPTVLNSPSEIQVATEVDPIELTSTAFRRRSILLVIIATLIVVAAAAVAVVGSSREPTPSPLYRSLTIDEFRDSLLPPDSLQLTLDLLPPQGLALRWLAGDLKDRSELGWRALQRFSLAVIYFSLSGKQWYNQSGWLDSSDECFWFCVSEDLTDVSPCDSTGRIVALGLPDNNLTGSIPPELTLLTNLEVIDLSDNFIYCVPFKPSFTSFCKQ